MGNLVGVVRRNGGLFQAAQALLDERAQRAGGEGGRDRGGRLIKHGAIGQSFQAGRGAVARDDAGFGCEQQGRAQRIRARGHDAPAG